MVTEADKTLKAVQTAIQMEIDGKEYYLKASQESSNELGKKLLQTLAAEEDIHRQKFEQIYESIRQKKVWPAVRLEGDKGRGVRTVFARGIKELGSKVGVLAAEIDAVQKAMEMENKTYDFYKSQGKNATYQAEKDFYESLAAQERQHHQVLQDYHDYLKDPAGYFVKKEHPSLDGG